MFFRNAFSSLFHLFAVFSFLAAGSFGICLYFSDQARWVVIEYLFAQPEILFSCGVASLAAGFFLMLGVYAIHKGKYLRVEMGRHHADIDVGLIQTAIEQCLKAHFGGQIVLVGVAASKNKRLEIEVETKQTNLLRELEGHLTPLLRKQFALVNPFYLTVRS